jgi:lipopolysaccharide biosynthesis regulator YciM
MKLLWLAIPVAFLVMWWMRHQNNSKAKNHS